jgi:outer membrane murein-binding lipoprotein Lpp
MGSLFTFNINNHVDLSQLERDVKQLKTIAMATKEQFQQALTELTSSIENIATDIQTLVDRLEQGGLSTAEEEEIFTQLRAAADRAKNIADINPEEPTTPTPQA